MADPGGVARTEPAAGGMSGVAIDAHRWLLPTVALGTILAPLNATMIAVAFPAIRQALGASVTQAAWLFTLYLAAMVVAEPISGWLGDTFGPRRVYFAGLVWYALATIGCALSPNLLALVLFRAQQALAGALIFPNGTAMVRETTGGNHRSSGFGIITFARGLGAAAGPPLGGILVHTWGWSSIFWVNLPVVALALLLGWPSLPRSAETSAPRPRFDWPGSLLLAGSLGALIATPTLYEQVPVSLAVVAAAAGLLLGGLFVWREFRTRAPVVNMRLFRHRPFAAACAAVALSNLIMYTAWLSVPLYLEEVRGHDVRVSGLTLAAMSVLFGLLGAMGGEIADRRGRRLPMMAGAICLAAGATLATGTLAGTSLLAVAGALAIMGIGLGLPDAAMQESALEPIPEAHTGSASGVYTTLRYLGDVAGSMAFALVFVRPPHAGQSGPFIGLFAGLTAVAIVGIAVTARVASWKPGSAHQP